MLNCIKDFLAIDVELLRQSIDSDGQTRLPLKRLAKWTAGQERLRTPVTLSLYRK
jgi:hypothetical protein